MPPDRDHRRVTFLVPPDDHEAWTQSARGEGISLTEWLVKAGNERVVFGPHDGNDYHPVQAFLREMGQHVAHALRLSEKHEAGVAALIAGACACCHEALPHIHYFL